MTSLQGSLLVAAPTLIDPNFWRTVVMVCGHDDDGALGVILNRPTEAEVADYLPGWTSVLAAPPVVFEGGPVQREAAVSLALWPGGGSGESWTAVTGDLGLLNLETGDGQEEVTHVRVFSGYAGWGAGQLEAEVGAGDWFVVPAHPDDAFTPEAELLWVAVLRRQPGRLRLYANYPPDPRLN